MIRAGAALCVAALAQGCATTAPPDMPVGAIRHYLRSNSDGTEAERISVYRADATHLSVFKARERCTRAALVDATLDPATRDATRLLAGKLEDDATEAEVFASLEVRDGALAMRLGPNGEGPVIQNVPLDGRPWHLYDYDLATLIAFPPKAVSNPMAFALVTVAEGGSAPLLRSLGMATLRYAGNETRNGQPAHHYRLTGPGFPGDGSIWFGSAGGDLIEARIALPNHAEYRDFHLRLTGSDQGAEAWASMIAAHWRDCQKSN